MNLTACYLSPLFRPVAPSEVVPVLPEEHGDVEVSGRLQDPRHRQCLQHPQGIWHEGWRNENYRFGPGISSCLPESHGAGRHHLKRCVCMYLGVFLGVYVCVCVSVCAFIVSVCACTRACAYLCVCVCVCVCMRTRVRMCMCVKQIQERNTRLQRFQHNILRRKRSWLLLAESVALWP